MDIKGILLAVLAGILAVALVGYFLIPGAPKLTLELSGMAPRVGQRFEIRLIDRASGVEVARRAIPTIVTSSFKVEFPGLAKGSSYLIDFYADVNGNGLYDSPPADDAWRLEVAALAKDTTLAFAYNSSFTDIGWPTAQATGSTEAASGAVPGTTPAPTSTSVSGPGAVAVDGAIGSGEYRHSLTEPTTGIQIYWQNDAEKLFIGLVSPGTGWVAIGFDPEQGMKGANIVIAAVVKEKLVIEDQYGTSPMSHSRDGSQDILAAAGKESGGKTTIEFAIPLESPDPADTVLGPGTTHRVMVAYQESSDDLNAKHTKRALTTLTLD